MLLGEMDRREIQKDIVTYTAALTVCTSSGQYSQAWLIWHELEQQQQPGSQGQDREGEDSSVANPSKRSFRRANGVLAKDTWVFSAFITLSSKSRGFSAAVEAFSDISRAGLTPTAQNYRALAMACLRAGPHHKRAVTLLAELKSKGQVPQNFGGTKPRSQVQREGHFRNVSDN